MKNIYFKVIVVLFIGLGPGFLFGMDKGIIHEGTIQMVSNLGEIATTNTIARFKNREFDFGQEELVSDVIVNNAPVVGDKLVRVKIEVEDVDKSDFYKKTILQWLENEKYKGEDKEREVTMIVPPFPYKLLENKQMGDLINFKAYGHTFNLKYKSLPEKIQQEGDEFSNSSESEENILSESEENIIKKVVPYLGATLVAIPVAIYIVKPGCAFFYSWLASRFRDELGWVGAHLAGGITFFKTQLNDLVDEFHRL